MHIDNGALVGTYVSDTYSEKGTVTIVLTDGDSTPTREYTRYKYVQTEQLTAIGVAVKDYGAVLVPVTTIELFENYVLDPADFGVFVKFNGNYYNIALSTLLATEIGASVTFNDGGLDSYPHTTFNATLPPFNNGYDGQVPTVDENGNVGWKNIPKELPPTAGKSGKFLEVNDNGTGVQWKDIPKENFIYDMKYFDNDGWYLCYKDTIDKVTDVVTGKDVRWTSQGVNKVYQMVKYEGTQESGYINLATLDSAKWYIRKIDRQNDGTYKWNNNESEYPQVPNFAAGDAGKVLKVNAGETGVEWGAASGGHLYMHSIELKNLTYDLTATFVVYNNVSTAYTNVSQVASAITGGGYYIASGTCIYNNMLVMARYVWKFTTDTSPSCGYSAFSVDPDTGYFTREENGNSLKLTYFARDLVTQVF